MEQVCKEALKHNTNWDEEYFKPAQVKATVKTERALMASANHEKRRAADFLSIRIDYSGH